MAWVDSVWLNLTSFSTVPLGTRCGHCPKCLRTPPCLEIYIATRHASSLNITKPMSRSTFQVHARDISPSAHEWGFCPSGGKLQTVGFPMRSGISFAWSFDCGGARISPLKAAAEWRAGRREPPSGDTYPASGAPPRASSTCVCVPLLDLGLWRSGVPKEAAGLRWRHGDRKCRNTTAATVDMELWRCDCTTWSLTWWFWYFLRNAAAARRDLGQIKAVRAARRWVGSLFAFVFLLLF